MDSLIKLYGFASSNQCGISVFHSRGFQVVSITHGKNFSHVTDVVLSGMAKVAVKFNTTYLASLLIIPKVCGSF